jgi:hypothetical protein
MRLVLHLTHALPKANAYNRHDSKAITSWAQSNHEDIKICKLVLVLRDQQIPLFLKKTKALKSWGFISPGWLVSNRTLDCNLVYQQPRLASSLIPTKFEGFPIYTQALCESAKNSCRT